MTTTRAFGVRNWLLMGALLMAFGTGAHAAFIPLTATLTGSQEVPPTGSPGMGVASFILDDVNRTLISAVTFQNLTSATTSAEIQVGTGLIVHAFPTATPVSSGFPIGVTQGSFTDVWTGLTPGNIAALVSGSYFINIRTSAFPGGEIRGQIAIPEPASLMLGVEGA